MRSISFFGHRYWNNVYSQFQQHIFSYFKSSVREDDPIISLLTPDIYASTATYKLKGTESEWDLNGPHELSMSPFDRRYSLSYELYVRRRRRKLYTRVRDSVWLGSQCQQAMERKQAEPRKSLKFIPEATGRIQDSISMIVSRNVLYCFWICSFFKFKSETNSSFPNNELVEERAKF